MFGRHAAHVRRSPSAQVRLALDEVVDCGSDLGLVHEPVIVEKFVVQRQVWASPLANRRRRARKQAGGRRGGGLATLLRRGA
jgi:hypothetical protein